MHAAWLRDRENWLEFLTKVSIAFDTRSTKDQSHSWAAGLR